VILEAEHLPIDREAVRSLGRALNSESPILRGSLSAARIDAFPNIACRNLLETKMTYADQRGDQGVGSLVKSRSSEDGVEGEAGISFLKALVTYCEVPVIGWIASLRV